jgi:fatty-acyl-CoA synthase
MIISGGFNIYPREVEDAVVAIDGVAACAVVGIADPTWGEAVAAVIVLERGARLDPIDIVARVREAKGSVHAPKQVRFADALPLTPIGKVDKKAIRKIFEDAA